MLMFTLAASCSTTSYLPWFMALTFQVPMQYCSLQHQTLLPSPVTSTAECCFCFDSASSFFLELFLYSSPVTYWAPTNLGNSSFSVLSFCLFILFKGFSRQEYWSGLPFPSPEDLPNPGIEPWSPALQANSLPFKLQRRPFKRVERIESSREPQPVHQCQVWVKLQHQTFISITSHIHN